MPKMLPAIPQAFGNLKDVFLSARESLSGKTNPLDLPRAKSTLVIMVDGLGWFNITNFAGHAPFLKKQMTKTSKGFSGFPSTTAASIVSLATGEVPSRHGFLGYRIYDRTSEESVNLLTGLDSTSVRTYLHSQQISQSVEVVVVSKPEYLESGFSLATFGDSRFVSATQIEERFDLALQELNSGSGKLIYLYVPELDQTAHRLGSKSNKWIELLELVDAQVKALDAKALTGRGIIVTADHGIVDVESQGHIYLDECNALSTSDLVDIGGDPRSTFIYFEAGTDITNKKTKIQNWIGESAIVLDIEDLLANGLYEKTALNFSNILPDLVVLAGQNVACYHRSFAKPASLNMIGQHGGISDAEITVPIIRLGSYSSSPLVP